MDKTIKRGEPNTPLEDWMRGVDVEDMLDISKRTLQTLRTNGTLPFTRLGGKIYYRRSDIERVLDDHFAVRGQKSDRCAVRSQKSEVEKEKGIYTQGQTPRAIPSGALWGQTLMCSSPKSKGGEV